MDAYNYSHFRFSHLARDAAGTWHLRGPKPGAMAPDFVLPDTNNETCSLRQLRGKPVLLHFGSYT